MKKNVMKNNFGFSLVEIVVAIALFAIVITPIMNGFISSARMNKRSREVMIATDVAQSILEGFSGRVFDSNTMNSVEDVAGSLGGLTLDPGLALSSINNNYYNELGNHNNVDISSDLSSIVDEDDPRWGKNYVGVDPTANTDKQEVLNKIIASKMIASNYTNPKILTGYSQKNFACFYYGLIDFGGYKFDAVVSIIPTADDQDDRYYPYRVLVSVYEDTVNANTTQATYILSGEVKPIVKLSTGIMNK